MNIIGGKFRGKKMKWDSHEMLRPTTSRVKEAMFNMIDCHEATVLDLFAGTGQLGIEALSRGAKFVMFNEFEEDHARFLRDNLNSLKGVDNYKVRIGDYAKFIKNYQEEPFDIIILDPSYKKPHQYEKSLRFIHEYKILKPNGIIVTEYGKEIKNKVIIDEENFIIEKEKQYGENMLLIIKERQE